MKKMGSLFAGIGGFDLGFERAGFEVAWCVEKDKNAQAVLRNRFPNAKIYGDITHLDPDTLERVDLICGGFPCQDLSVAGKRAGLAGERSGLFHDAMRIVRRLNPSIIILENVPGLLSSNRGLDFAAVLREVGEGWDCQEVAWRVLDSQYFGVAQRRKRVFVVAGSRVGCSDEILALSEGVCGDPPSRDKTREGTPADSAGSVDGGRWWDGSDCFATLTKQNANGSQRMPDKGNLGAVVIDRAAFNQGTNAAYKPRIEESDWMSSLVARGSHAIAFHSTQAGSTVMQAYPLNGMCLYKELRDRQMTSIGEDGDAMYTVRANGMQHAVAHAFYSTGGTHGLEPHPNICPPIKIGSTLGIPSPPAVAIDVYNQTVDGDCAATVTTRKGGADSSGPKVLNNMVVRRLTPVECERLQGFPDGWTDIGTPQKPTADSHRYKQLGNAVTVNVAEWIARRAYRCL